MPTFYNFIENGVSYSFNDIFVPADIFREGNLWTWGTGANGRLGVNDTTDISTPITTSAGGANWKQVGTGNVHTAAIKTDGTLWTWGAGSAGQLGNFATTQRNTPVTTFAGGTNWKQVSCGSDCMVAIKTDGTLWIWGNGNTLQLGVNDTVDRNTPVTTFAGGTNWKQVSSGTNFTAAIKTDGTLWTWGFGTNGRLGVNDANNRSTPVTTFIGGTTWKQVSCGNLHTAAIKTDGTLWTWGAGTSGQLGNNDDTTDRSTPVTTFLGGTTWKQVSCGNLHTAAIKTDGTLWTWGSGISVQLGINSANNRSIPVTTFAGGTNWKQVSGGKEHTAAIKTDGTLWIWGNGTALLGVNDGNNRYTPVTTFIGGTNWKQVSCGNNFTSATQYDDYSF